MCRSAKCTAERAPRDGHPSAAPAADLATVPHGPTEAWPSGQTPQNPSQHTGPPATTSPNLVSGSRFLASPHPRMWMTDVGERQLVRRHMGGWRPKAVRRQGARRRVALSSALLLLIVLSVSVATQPGKVNRPPPPCTGRKPHRAISNTPSRPQRPPTPQQHTWPPCGRLRLLIC